MTYEKKIEHAIKKLRAIPQDGPIELCYFGIDFEDIYGKQ